MPHPRRSGSLFFVILLLAGCRPAATPYACADPIGCIDVPPGGPLQIAALQVLSGDQQPFGLAGLRSIQMALDDRGAMLLDHPIRLQVEDSLCSKEGGATAAAKLAADRQMVGIVGPSCSGAAETAIKVISEAGLVLISGSATAHELTSVSGEAGRYWRPGFLRTAQNDAFSGRAAASFAFERLGIRKAATIDDGDPYTRGLASIFRQVLTELGGEAVLAATVNKGDAEMGPVLAAVAESGAELLFFPLFQPEGDLLVIQARKMPELAGVTLLTAEGLYLETFLASVGEAGGGLYLVIPTTPGGPARDGFVARYRTTYGEEPATSYYAQSYDAANLLLSAVEQVAVQDEDGTLHLGRQALRDALYATSGFQGLTGSLTCDRFGDCGLARFHVVRLEDAAAGLGALTANVVYAYPPEP